MSDWKEALERLSFYANYQWHEGDHEPYMDAATIRAHIEGLEAREAALSEQVCTVTGWCEAANKRAEAAEARVRELEGGVE